MTEQKAPKREIQSLESVPYDRIAQDLAQGYLLSYPLKERKAKKYVVVKCLGEFYFRVSLEDYDSMSDTTSGATLFIYKTDRKERIFDGFSVDGRKKQEGSYGFWEDDSSVKVGAGFWEEYLQAQINPEATKKREEFDTGIIRNATIQPKSPQVRLALDTSTKNR